MGPDVADYALDPPCRVGITRSYAPGPNGPRTWLHFHNLGFTFLSGQYAVTHEVHGDGYDVPQIHLSPDQSIAVIVSANTGGGANAAYVVNTIDLVHSSATTPCRDFFTGAVGTVHFFQGASGDRLAPAGPENKVWFDYPGAINAVTCTVGP